MKENTAFNRLDASVHSTLAGILPFGASFLVRDDGGAHLNPALENRVAQFGLSPSRNPGILLLTHAHSKPKNNPAFHRRFACVQWDVFSNTAVQNRHKSSDPCCKRGLYVPGTGVLRLRSAAVS